MPNVMPKRFLNALFSILVLLSFLFVVVPAFARDRPSADEMPSLEDVVRVMAPDGLRSQELTGRGPLIPRKFWWSGAARFPFEFRTTDGTYNNLSHPEWGATETALLRLTTVDYEDGQGTPAGAGRASAREISNLCVAQTGLIPNSVGATDYLWQWGQFIDHDVDLSLLTNPPEPFDIDVPLGDPYFDPFSLGGQQILLDRADYEVIDGVRQQFNVITAFIDASNVYGSDEARALELRTLDGTGRLEVSAGNLLPFNVNGLPNAPNNAPGFFLAGDERANEQVGLTAMHTLFVREHNYWADRFGATGLIHNGDLLYKLARSIVGAEMQAITYREFLPLLLGPGAISPYSGYDSAVDPGVANVFATAAYRVGHSMLSPELLRFDAAGNEISAGHLALVDAFFNPAEIIDEGIDPILRGLATQSAQEIDSFIIDGVRNFLFGPPGAGGFDLASLNIQRGRDHGLPGYNQVRVDYGLAPVTSFADINSDPQVQANLSAAYLTVDDIDIWVGGLSESHYPGALVGETFRAIIADQFERLRDGDRFWYRSYFGPLSGLINYQTLARIIRRNTGIGSEIQAHAFTGATLP